MPRKILMRCGEKRCWRFVPYIGWRPTSQVRTSHVPGSVVTRPRFERHTSQIRSSLVPRSLTSIGFAVVSQVGCLWRQDICLSQSDVGKADIIFKNRERKVLESGCGNLSIVFHMVVAGYIWKTTEMCHRTFRSYLTIVSMGGVGVQNWCFSFVLNAFVDNDLPAKLQNTQKYA